MNIVGLTYRFSITKFIWQRQLTAHVLETVDCKDLCSVPVLCKLDLDLYL